MNLEKKNIIIVGAGIIGISSALYLIRRGCKITLIDKDFKGKPASYGNASWLSGPSITPVVMPGMFGKIPKMLFSKDGPLFLRFPGFLKTIPFLLKYLSYAKVDKVEYISKHLASLLSDSIGEHKKLAEGTRAIKWIEESPFLFVYKNKDDFTKDSFTWGLRKKYGFNLIEIEKKELQNLLPGLSNEYQFAIKINDQGYISNSQNYLDDLINGFKDLGGEIIEDEVIDIFSKERKVEIKTKKNNLSADNILISSGIYSESLSKKFGVKVPIQSERGYHLELFETNIRIKYPIMNGYLKLAITPRPTGIRFAGLVEFGSMHSKPNNKAYELLLRNAKLMFPDISYERKQEWSGHRPSTVDSLPIIGPSKKDDKVFFAYGHHHIGLTAGPKTGEMIGKNILRENDQYDLTAYSPNR